MSEIESLQKDVESFPPPKDFAQAATIGSMERYEELRKQADEDPEGFWAEQARRLEWMKPFDQVLDWQPPFAKWFVGGKLNASANCLDRHLDERGDKPAIVWEGEPGDSRKLSFRELHAEVCRFANALKSLKLKKGDCVGIYMPMVPEAAIAMLACARLGLPHNVVFGGFSAEAVAERMKDSKAKCVITADGAWRRGKVLPLKPQVDDALKKAKTVKHVVVLRRTENDVAMKGGRDHWWHELVDGQDDRCDPVALDSEHPLFILYTSGSTGKPKGIYHTTGGYMTHAQLSSEWVFDLKEDDVYWCTADVGWITGHSYVVYGPLAAGATTVMYEGAPNHPFPDRFWALVDKYKVSVFYTAPTAIRAFMKWGDKFPSQHRLESLRLLGTVGEPINPEAWLWYHKLIGKGRCPIVDTWWQTETGGILISPLPGATPTKPGSATLPLPGIDAAIVDEDGNELPWGEGGLLVIRRPWPSMLRGIWGDEQRYRDTYWTRIDGAYFPGDGARRDKDGYFWIMGRVDDVVNVSGHRLGTAEIESALVSHPAVVEAAVVGRPDELTGQAMVAFVTTPDGTSGSKELGEELRAHVAKEIGSLAKPAEIHFADGLPKTRSGKIMRRLLREISTSHEVTGDTTTLEDRAVIEKLVKEFGEDD